MALECMKNNSSTYFVAVATIVGGLLLQTYQLLFLAEAPMDSFLLKLVAWSFAPYVVCGIVLFGFRASWPVAVGGCFALIADLCMHYSVFIHPRGSTAAVGLVFMPVANLFFILPVGLLVGWLISKRVSSNAL
jgi:hypothetical protein